MGAKRGPYEEHAYSRYCDVSVELIEGLQAAYFEGRDLGRVYEHIDGDWAAVVVAETLEADRVWNLGPEQLLDGRYVQPERMSDFKRAVLAELTFSIADVARENDDEEQAAQWWAIAMSQLEEIARSPVASPLLWYENIYMDLAYALHGEEEAIAWAKRALAHDLRIFEGDSAIELLRDLADMVLAVDQLDTGLAMLAALLHHDPGYIWTYNGMAIAFDRYGLVALGTRAAERALALIEAEGDRYDLRAQLEDCLETMATSNRRGREAEVDPQVLQAIQDALALDFGAGDDRDVTALCRELVPDLDEVPVKRPMQPADVPLPPLPAAVSRRKLGRNDPCWCGSGKKYKHCHWREDHATG